MYQVYVLTALSPPPHGVSGLHPLLLLLLLLLLLFVSEATRHTLPCFGVIEHMRGIEPMLPASENHRTECLWLRNKPGK